MGEHMSGIGSIDYWPPAPHRPTLGTRWPIQWPVPPSRDTEAGAAAGIIGRIAIHYSQEFLKNDIDNSKYRFLIDPSGLKKVIGTF